ncbi:MAG TPA: aldehyde dehydrogenase (NADP(+)) [Thermoanaerobaculia bacterium]|nr:aldehyde dehydrogenase (NADP(+)) [Thermoanaerobaculia bacterium]
MTLLGTSIVGASRADAKGTPFRAFDPSRNEAIAPEFFSATQADVDRAVSLALDAFASYRVAFAGYRDASGKEKGAFLRRIAANLESVKDALVTRANLETALPVARLQSEHARTCGQLRLFAALVEEGSWVDARIDRGDPARTPQPKPDLRSMLRPLGPVVVFGASNFPLAFSVAGGDTASALAAGCPVIVKAHPAHPGTSEIAGLAIRDAVRECGLHEGVFSLLFDGAYDVGLQLVQHDGIRAVAFTGSRRGGHALMDAASRRREPIPVYAEMGSINPVFVLPGALRERGDAIAAGLHASVTLGVGQFCTNPGVIVAERGITTDALVRELAQRIDASAAGTMLTAGICGAYRESVSRLAQTRGVTRIAGSDVPDRGAAALFATNAASFASDATIRDEVFGPSTIVVTCDDASQLLDVARALEGQLSVTVHGTPDDLDTHRELIRLLETKAGRLVFNGYPTGVEVAHATVHGGPYPATSDGRSTSVGTRAIERFTRAVCWQDCPDALLPPELQESNPLGLLRLVDGRSG